MTVLPFTLKNDKLQLTPTLDMELAILLVKGVDGIFTDFVHSTYKTFCLYGSRSNFPVSTVNNQTPDSSIVTLTSLN